MHSTETPNTARFRHRLYVVLPLFLALAWAGISDQPTASLIQAESVVVEGGSTSLSGSLLHVHGSSLVASKTFINAEANGFSIRAWNGALDIDAHAEGMVTIAALTTPVLITRDADTWLVPVGMQMTVRVTSGASPTNVAEWAKSRRPLPLPAHYLRERLPKAEELLSHSIVQPLTSTKHLLSPLAGSMLMFDASHTEATKEDQTQRLARLSTALLQQDTSAFDDLVRDAATRTALDTADLSDVFTLLTLAVGEKRESQILPSLLHNPQLALLLRFHPLLREGVWLSDEARNDHDLLLLGQMLLPLSDDDETAVSDVSVETWRQGWEILHPDASVANVLAPLLATDIAALDDAGYPIRARAYAAAFVTSINPLPEGLSDAAQAAINRLHSIYDIVLSVADPAELPAAAVTASSASSASSAVSSSIPLTEEEVRALLIAHGCMFTSQSTLNVQEGGAYAVDNVVLGTRNGDRIISFTFDSAAGLVSGIEKDGHILPYSLTLEKYLEWVKN